MSLFFDICCGEGDEPFKQGAFADSVTETDWEDDDDDLQQQKKDIAVSTREKAAVAAQLKHGASIFSCPIDLDMNMEYKVYEKTELESAFLLECMKNHFIFEELTDKELNVLIDATEKVLVEPSAKVVRQNEFGEFLYIVQEGNLDIYCEMAGKVMFQLSKGQLFGETGLLYGCKCDATVLNPKEAKAAATIWRIDQQTFRLVLAKHAHAQDEDILACLQRVELFQGMQAVKLQKFAASVSRVKFQEGDKIIKKGEIGEMFYILQEGSVKVHDIGIGDSQASTQILKGGDCFGERALLTGEPRAASITAMTKDVVCLAMDRKTFQQNIGDLQDLVEFRGKLQSLQSLPIFANSNITKAELERLADLTAGVCYRKGAKLCQSGKPYPLNVWFIRSGQVLVYGGKKGKIFNLQTGDYFGEKSILGDPTHVSSHEATCEEKTSAWVLSREAIESVIVDLNRLGKSGSYLKQSSSGKLQRTIRSLKDLTLHRILGQGGFGKVFLVESKWSSSKKSVYALKVINKRKLLASKQERGVLREKELLQLLHHPFILNMESSFQDAANLYLVLPLIQGGELFNVLADHAQKSGGGLPNNDAAFYAAGIIEALGHFHHRYIAYRDLKLENVMIDADGYPMVVDLGFAKIVLDKSYTFCGTPEYLAPEIIMSKGHNHGVDYWSFGVLLYELLAGRSPFNKPNLAQMEMFKRIVTMKYSMPKTFDEQAQDLVRQLLQRKLTARLGMLSRGHYDVKEHSWFASSGIDYKKLLQKELTPPWKPQVKDPLDASNFGDADKNVTIQSAGGSLTKEQQSVFKGF